MDRQRRLFARRPDLTIILGAAAASLVVGSPEVMSAQLAHIDEVVASGGATVRVLPWTVGAYPMRGNFTILEFDHGDDPTVTYVEFAGGGRYVEQPDQVREYEGVFADLLSRSVSLEEWRT